MVDDFEAVLAEGLAVDVESHWGAGFLAGRYLPGQPPWSWEDVVRPRLDRAGSCLDMGTGEGAVLAGLQPLPALTVAQEEWLPTVPAAAATLRPLGVHLVVARGATENTADQSSSPALPFRDEAFDIVLNRHEAFDPAEVRRVLRPGGVFCTQQVGHGETTSIRALLDLPPLPGSWDAAEGTRQIRFAGLEVGDAQDCRQPARFADIAALIAYVRSVPWEVPEFEPDRFRRILARLHERCLDEGAVTAITHRFLVVARRSEH